MLEKKHKKIFLLLSVLVFIVPFSVHAQGGGGFVVENPEGWGLFNQVFGCRFYQGAMCIVEKILSFLLTIAFTVALIFLVLGGYRYVTARGNDEALAQAKKMIIRSIIGVVIIALAFIILALVLNTIYSGSPFSTVPPAP